MPDGKVSRSISNRTGSIHEQIDREIIQRQQRQEHEQETNPVPMDMKKKKKKALLEFRCQVEDSILGNYLLGKNQNHNENINIRDIKLWGVPLLPSRGHKSTDIVLMKFLKAKDYKVSDAFNMLRKTMKWRRDFKVDGILEEKFGSDLEQIGFVDGHDKAGHPLCYINHEVLNNRENLRKRFGTKEACEEFVRWRIQLMEKCISKLDFAHGGSDSFIQIFDLSNISRTTMKTIVRISKKYTPIFNENYPGIVFRNVMINVPIWFLALYSLHLRWLTQKYKFKGIYVRPARVTETLLKFIAPENIPVQYGGLSTKDGEFSPDDKVLEQRLKGSTTECIQILTKEAGMTIFWDMSVVGYEVSYKEEFVPDDECSYKVLIQKGKQIGKSSVANSFHITEPGKIVITFENPTYKRRRVFYRYKIKPTIPMYILFNKDDN